MYQTLRGLGAFIEVIGWIVCGVSFLFLLYFFITAADSRQPAGVVLVSLIPTLIGVVSGILIASYGQVVLCFTGIEENTRKTFVALEDLSSRIVDNNKGNAQKSLLAGLQLREPEVEAKASAKPVDSGFTTLGVATVQTTCSNCRKTFPGALRGQYCEECGTML